MALANGVGPGREPLAGVRMAPLLKGLILSGGRGTRLRPITHTSAKQLLPIANRPILFYAIDAVVAAGVRDIGIVTGETGAEVEAAVGDGGRFGACITYIRQPAPLGLAHAVATARPYLGDEPFVVYLGDNLVRQGIVPVVQRFQETEPDAMILLAKVPDPGQFGVAQLSDGRVTCLVEKPAEPLSDLALVGVYLFSSRVFEAIEGLEYSARGELEITDAIQAMIDAGRRVEPHVITGAEALVATWKDTGRLEDLLEANRIVLDDIPPRRHQGTIAPDVRLDGKVLVESGASLRGCSVRGPVIIGSGAVVEEAYIGPYTSIGAGCTIRRAEVEHSIVLERTAIEDVDGKIESSLIGRDCVITRTPVRPRAVRLMIGDHSRVELR